MTSPQPNHLLLNARSGWQAAALDGLSLERDEALMALIPLPGSARPLVDATGSFGSLALPTGLAVDAEDRIYILDGQAQHIKRFDPCDPRFEVLACIAGPGSQPRQVRDPQGLAISSWGDLYVADTGNRRVQVFALNGLALRGIWGPLRVVREQDAIRVTGAAPAPPVMPASGECTPADPTFPDGTWQPWDVVVGKNGRVYVSDYANGLIHVFDRRGRWLAAFTGEGPTLPPLAKPTHLAVDRDCNLYVVQEGLDFVTVLNAEGEFQEQIKLAEEDVRQRFCPTAIAVDEAGNLCLGERFSRRLHVYCKSPDGCYAHAGTCAGFQGQGRALAFDSAGNPLVADAGRQQVFCLERQAAYVTQGRYYSQPLDSRIYRCQWHRVVIAGRVEPGTQIRVDTFTSETPKTAAEIQGLVESRWATSQTHATVGIADWDCLVLSPPGRYLWLRVTLSGNGKATPTIAAVKAYYPRESSLGHLPATYQEDAVGRDFMDRFLSISDTLRDGIGDEVTHIARYFDPAATPAKRAPTGQTDFLSWLASWIGLSLDYHWPEAKRRRLVQQAHRLYALRGTPQGLQLHLQLYTDAEAHILEHFKLRRWLYLDQTRLGEDSALYGQSVVPRLQLDRFAQIGDFQLVDSGDPQRDPFHYYAHQFTVYIPARSGRDETQRQTLERIVELAKPAHAKGTLSLVEPRFRVGVQAFVGVDTVVGKYPDEVVAGDGRLGHDTVLGPSHDEATPPTLRVGLRSRIGSSTLID